MENKEDWKKIEKWAENKQAEKIEKFGIDINQIEMSEKQKKMDQVQKVVKPIGKGIKIIFILVIVFIAMGILIMLDVNFSNLRSSDIDSIGEQYSVKTNIISKEVDERENGKYILEVKNYKDIQFTAIRNNKKLLEDFKANFQKHIFNSWKSPIKERFEVEELVDEKGLLSYRNYIVAKEAQELEEVTEYFIEFLEYAEKWNKENKVVKIWQQKQGQFIVPIDISIKIEEDEIYPYHSMFQTAQEIREEVKNKVTL